MVSTTYFLISMAIMVILLMGGLWISFAIGIGGIATLYPVLKQSVLLMYGLTSWSTSTDYILVALPLYIFMGEFLSKTELVKHLYSGASKTITGLPGGLIQVNLFVCAIFAACAGSSTASASTMARLTYNEQVVKRGYDAGFVLGSVAGGGTLAILIPPSLWFIIYGSMADQSIGKLFTAGVVPGLAVTLMFMIYAGIRSILQPGLVGKDAVREDVKWRNRIAGLKELWPFILLIVMVLGSTYAGVATPTEAAGLGSLTVIIMAIAKRSFTWKLLLEACLSTVKTNSFIFLIMINAKIVSLALGYYGIPFIMKDFAQSIESGVILITVISIVYLALGTIFDDFSILILLLPFMVPMVQAAGYDLIWFGVFMCILLQAGLLSPPVGMNLFVMQGVTGAPFGTVVRGSIPYFIVLILGGLMILVEPNIVLWLPRYLAQ
jgi:C4-dicarboxylate transporter, DctM subunit